MELIGTFAIFLFVTGLVVTTAATFVISRWC